MKKNGNKKTIISKGKIKLNKKSKVTEARKKPNKIVKKIESKKSIVSKSVKAKKNKKNPKVNQFKGTKVVARRRLQKVIRSTRVEVPVNNEINLLPNSGLKSENFISGPIGIKPYKPVKDEEYMNSKQLEHFKNILNIWKEQLMSEMNRTVQHLKSDAANFPDPVDRASQEEEFNLELKTRERERKLIKKIDEALEKIQGGDYGFCLDCGAEIGIKRLEARPTATQCIECKTIAEIREKQIGG